MSIYLNVFPITKYPKKIALEILGYSEDNYQKYSGFCYRIGNNLYVYRNSENTQKVLTTDVAEFSLVLQHLILKAFQNSYNKKNYRIEEKAKRLTIIRNKPSIETDYVDVFEGIEIQTLHWQDINFGIVVDYLTKNNFTEKFAEEKVGFSSSLPFPSYYNFYKYLGEKEAKNIMTKIADLRRERALGRARSDALNQRMLKIKELLKDCLDWEDTQEKELPLPTGTAIAVSTKNIEVILLSTKGDTYE